MKRLLTGLLILLAIVVIVASAGVGYVFARYPNVPPAATVSIAATPAILARGEYLVRHVTMCVECHSMRDMTKYAGPVIPGSEGGGGEFFGDEAQGLSVYSRNITPAAIGSWTDG